MAPTSAAAAIHGAASMVRILPPGGSVEWMGRITTNACRFLHMVEHRGLPPVAFMLALAAGCVTPPTPTAPTARTRPVVTGYLAGWGVRSKGTRIESLSG